MILLNWAHPTSLSMEGIDIFSNVNFYAVEIDYSLSGVGDSLWGITDIVMFITQMSPLSIDISCLQMNCIFY